MSDEMEGKLEQAKGWIKEQAGELTDNPTLAAKGKAQNAAGKTQESWGKLKKGIGTAVDAVGEAISDSTKK